MYVSFNHKIYVYWKVELERMESTNLLRLLEEKEQFRGLLKELRVGESLLRWCAQTSGCVAMPRRGAGSPWCCSR